MYRLPLLLLPMALAACDQEQCMDMTGAWTLTVTEVTSSCGPEDGWTSSLQITQEACESQQFDVSGIKGSTDAVTGAVDGEEITISGRFDEEDGVTALTLTLTRESDTELSGSESWEWFATPTDAQPTCTDGTATASLTKD